MSLATLKRKTLSKYNNSSVNTGEGFSLNGTYRNQGYVGQTSLSRSLPRTLMKGNTPRGHGGCCGTYTIIPIIQSGVKSTEDNSVVKKSVVNTNGMLDIRFACNSCNVVKPTHSPMSNIIEYKKKEVTKCSTTSTTNENSVCNNKCRKISYYTKPESEYIPISGTEHVLNIKNRCITNDIKYVPVSVNRTPFP